MEIRPLVNGNVDGRRFGRRGVTMDFDGERKETAMRKKWTVTLWVLLTLAVLSFGCTGGRQETKVRCPKCGATFTMFGGSDWFGFVVGQPQEY